MSRSHIISLLLLVVVFEIVVVLGAIFIFESNPLGPLMFANAAAITVVVSRKLYTRIRSKPAQLSGPAPYGPKTENRPDPQEIECELRKRISDANVSLAASGKRVGDRQVRGLADYPLYLLLGPAGTGKTSLLVHSGLEPKLLSRSAYGDAGTAPTKSCNFWLARDAVFADVSSEILLGPSERWLTFVRMLRNHSVPPLYRRLASDVREETLKGVILVLDSSSLLGPETSRNQATPPSLIRERLQDLGMELGCEFPVYTVFGKADSLPYFTDFWERLTESEDQRVVGVTLPLANTDSNGSDGFVVDEQKKRLTRYYSRLCISIADKRTMMLAREPLSASKPPIYEFPRELKRIRGSAVELLVELFRQTTLRRGPCLRGFYFTGMSRTRNPRTFDGVPEFSTAQVGSAATVLFSRREVNEIEEIRPSTSSSGSRWVFAGELFEIILRDPAFMRRSGDQSMTLMAKLAAAITLPLMVILCAGWTTSWLRNSSMLDDFTATAAASRAPASPVASGALQNLESLRKTLVQLEAHRSGGAPMSMRWGLYSGERAAESLRHLYFLRFRAVFLDPIAAELSGGLLRLQPGLPAGVDVYDRLKVYRMLTSGTCRPESPALERTLPAAWPYLRSLAPAELSLADRQLRFYISELLVKDPYSHQILEDRQTVTHAQAWLAQAEGTGSILNAAIAEVNRLHDGVNLGDFSPNFAEVLKGPDSVEWSYTPEGWRAVHVWMNTHRQPVGDACVIGPAAAGWSLLHAAQPGSNGDDAFVKQYIARWQQFIGGQQVRPYTSAADATQKLRLLSDTRSPLLALVYMVSKNTTFPAEPMALPQVLEKKKPSSINRLLRRGASPQPNPAAAPFVATRAAVSDITRAYQPAGAVVSGANQDRWLSDANRAYFGALGELGDSLRAFDSGPAASVDQVTMDQAYKARDKAWAAVRQLEQTFNNTPEQIDVEMKRLLESPITALDAILPANRNQQLVAQANEAARRLCREFEPVRKKYPFDPHAEAEVTIDELVRLFAPGTGALAQLTSQAPLNVMLQKQGNAWTLSAGGQQPRLLPQFLQMVNNFSRLADALFPNGPKPYLEYSLSLDSTSTLIPFELEIGGVKVAYAGAPSPKVQYVWPAADGRAGAKLVVRSGLTLDSTAGGVWALLRLLERADNPRPGLFTINKLTFAGSNVQLRDSSGQVVTLEIHVDSTHGAIFRRGYFSEYSCASRAAQ